MDAVHLAKDAGLLALKGIAPYIPEEIVNLQESEVRLIAYTTATVLVVSWIWSFLCHEKSLFQRSKDFLFGNLRSMPFVGAKIQSELNKVLDHIADDESFRLRKGEVLTTQLPAKGLDKRQVIKQADDMDTLLGGADWKSGRVSGAVYSNSEDLTEALCTVYSKFAWSNPLHADVFPSIRKMEGEVVQMTVDMFNGNEECCGAMTSGGTESILMACRAYRQVGYDRGISVPEIVAPISVHAAFDKACEYFRMKLIHVPVNVETRQVDLRAMRRAISSSTVLLVGSAPQFPHGTIDDIEGIAELGRRYSVGVHVDACLGGFLIPFMEEAGFPLPPFDFRVPGVTSISADTHKYGFAPKGSSVIMYSSYHLRHKQYFVAPDWQGGIYASPSIAGSRAGGIIAACWAAMMFMGRDGYVMSTKKICTVAQQIQTALSDVPGLFIYGRPNVSVVAFGSKVFDIYRLGAALTECGWNLNSLQFPASIHICCTLRHTDDGIADQFIKDVKECTAEIMKTPHAKSTGSAAIYGMAQAIPDRSLVKEIAWGFIDTCLNAKR